LQFNHISILFLGATLSEKERVGLSVTTPFALWCNPGFSLLSLAQKLLTIKTSSKYLFIWQRFSLGFVIFEKIQLL